MVEIKRAPSGPTNRLQSPASDSSDDGKYRLIYSKSKVYVNPTAYARDNIPGFVALVRQVSTAFDSFRRVQIANSQQEAASARYLLAWIPERLLNEKGKEEWNKFVKMEERATVDDEDEGVLGLEAQLCASR